jgi:hypothetical protein
MMMGWGIIGGCPMVRSIYIRLGVDAFPIQKVLTLVRIEERRRIWWPIVTLDRFAIILLQPFRC